MSGATRIITDRLDAWVHAGSPLERALVIVEAAVALGAVAVACAALWRTLAGPVPLLAPLTHPAAIMAAFGFAVAALGGRLIPRGQARRATVRADLADALSEAIGRQPRADLEAVIEDAFGAARVREAVTARVSGDGLAERIDAAIEADAEGGADAETEAFDAVLSALQRPAERKILARWLTRLLADRPDLIDGIARPVTKRLLRDSWFDRPFSWGELEKHTRKFLDRRKGQAWADAVIGRALDDLARRPARARAVHAMLLPTVRAETSRQMSRVVGEHLSRDETLDDWIADAAADVHRAGRPALLGALGHMVDERAAAAADGLDPARLDRLLRRGADEMARRLRIGGFVGGGLVGALFGLWS